ncbi:phosphatidylinositol kinase [Vibrio parahaemolyticus]|nr:phosphatidylinositol kinase [Vibrio parahaemolyticus]EJG0961917.1 phosphatidylinositol kinase [Vibrio parahaemolyticus]
MDVSQVKMPFAISNQTGHIIGIAEVERGGDCDCRCLSCGTLVTARQGSSNQWHFGHRTCEVSTSNECRFSPVTALALIIRQELPQLVQFDLDEWTFSDTLWELEVIKHGFHCDAYAKDAETGISVLVEIPFADGKMNDVDQIPEEIDLVLRVDTHLMANALYVNKPKDKVYRADEVFCLLLEHWGKWVSMERWPEQKSDNIAPEEVTDKYEAIDRDEGITASHPLQSSTKLCIYCDVEPGFHAKGLLCRTCVRRYVGPRFNSISEMASHYKKLK